MTPSPTEENGRGADGRFLPGNHLAKGNPFARRVNELRKVLLDAVGDKDLQAVVKKLLAAAKAGEGWAIKELLDRLLGKDPLVLAELAEDLADLRRRLEVRL